MSSVTFSSFVVQADNNSNGIKYFMIKYLICLCVFLCSFQPLDSNEENEILTVKCSEKMLVYIINTIYNAGFRIVSMSCNEPVEPIWVINYCY